jgi:hypothetical protein
MKSPWRPTDGQCTTHLLCLPLARSRDHRLPAGHETTGAPTDERLLFGFKLFEGRKRYFLRDYFSMTQEGKGVIAAHSRGLE